MAMIKGRVIFWKADEDISAFHECVVKAGSRIEQGGSRTVTKGLFFHSLQRDNHPKLFTECWQVIQN